MDDSTSFTSNDARSHERLFTGAWLEVRRHDNWEYVHRLRGQSVVMVIAVTPEREIVFVEQPRIPVGARTIEIPAGLVGDLDASDTPKDAARRELLEETGFAAGSLEALTEGCASAGLADEHIHVFFASKLERVSDGGGVDGEDIRVHLVPLDDAHRWLEERRRDGNVLDIKVFSALWLAAQRLQPS